MRKLVLLLLSVLFIGVVACGGEAGEPCDEEGIVDGECDEGLVCGRKTSTGGDLVCLKQCSAQTDCGTKEAFLGVGQSSLKACRSTAQP